MNRDELLQQVLGIDPAAYKPGNKMIEATIGADLVAHCDIYWRRAIILPTTVSDGENISTAGTTIHVAAIANVCVAPDKRGIGWGRELIESAHLEAMAHQMTAYSAVYGCLDFYGRFGYQHPAGAVEEDLLVFALGEQEWPEGKIRMDRW